MSTTVFFADDHKLFRQTLIPALKSFDIITTAEAENGAELLELLKEKQPDIVLLDLEMPVMNGSQALRISKKTLSRFKNHYHQHALPRSAGRSLVCIRRQRVHL